jgi:hypothetical protein
MTLAERFNVKVRRARPDECWPWLGTRTPTGYGQIRVRTPRGWRMLYAHRIAYELSGGVIPVGHEVDHLCFTPGCVNPTHLEAVTPAENHRRRRGRPRRHRPTPKCNAGHAREGNTRVNSRGARFCVVCHRQAVRRHRDRALKGGQ